MTLIPVGGRDNARSLIPFVAIFEVTGFPWKWDYGEYNVDDGLNMAIIMRPSTLSQVIMRGDAGLRSGGPPHPPNLVGDRWQ